MAYTFCRLKRNRFTELVAESVKVELKTQQSVCDHCEELTVGTAACVMTFQEMELATMDEVDAEDFDLSNIDNENKNEFRTPVFDTDEVVPIWSDEIED